MKHEEMYGEMGRGEGGGAGGETCRKFPLAGFLSHLVSCYIRHMSYVRLHCGEQFRSKKYLLEMTPSRAKMRLKRRPKKLNF